MTPLGLGDLDSKIAERVIERDASVRKFSAFQSVGDGLRSTLATNPEQKRALDAELALLEAIKADGAIPPKKEPRWKIGGAGLLLATNPSHRGCHSRSAAFRKEKMIKRNALWALALCLCATIARADDKADAILKEVSRRAASLTTYSVTLELLEGKKTQRIAFWGQRPDKMRVEIRDGKHTQTMIVNGERGVAGEDSTPAIEMPTTVRKEIPRQMWALATGSVGTLMKGIVKSTYVTQKMLDEATVVDVIDVFGKGEGNAARLYIAGDGQVRKIVNRSSKNKGETILYKTPLADEPIPAEKFVLPEKK